MWVKHLQIAGFSLENKESVFIIHLRSVQNEASTVAYYESLADS